jgi:hypothetical protein
MLNHETEDEEKVNMKRVLVEIFEGGEYITYLLAGSSLWKQGPTFRTLFWHLIPFRSFEKLVLFFSISLLFALTSMSLPSRSGVHIFVTFLRASPSKIAAFLSDEPSPGSYEWMSALASLFDSSPYVLFHAKHSYSCYKEHLEHSGSRGIRRWDVCDTRPRS